ncbi:MAG: hypothetical protein V1820_03560 [archaeon]
MATETELSSPIEHRHYSRVIGPLAREATYHWRAVLVLSFLLLAGGLAVTTDPVFTAYLGNTVILFISLVAATGVLVTLMLRSFRKALTALYPALISVPVTLLIAYALGESPSGIETIFATFAFTTAVGLNYTLVKKYFDERRKPATVLTSLFETFSKLSKSVAGVYVIETLMFLGIAAFTYEMTGFLGILVAIANGISLVATVTVVPAAVMFYEHAMAARVLSEHEEKVLGYVKSYGKDRKHAPLIASWLGVAASDVEKAFERLAAKGFLGSHFFAIDDPFVWFLMATAYFLGTVFARSGAPSLTSIWYDLGIVFLVTVSVCLFSPQNFPGISKGVRRLLGLLLGSATVFLAFRTSPILLEAVLALLVVGLASIFFASSGVSLAGNAAVSVYFALVFLLGWLQFDLIENTPMLWAVGIGAIVFLMLMLVEEEAYIPIKRE